MQFIITNSNLYHGHVKIVDTVCSPPVVWLGRDFVNGNNCNVGKIDHPHNDKITGTCCKRRTWVHLTHQMVLREIIGVVH